MGAYDMLPGLLGGNYGLQPPGQQPMPTPMQRPMPALQPQAQQTMGGRVGGIFGDFMTRFRDMQQNNPQALMALASGMMAGDVGVGMAGAGDAMAQYREKMAGQQEQQRQTSLTKRYLLSRGISEEEADAAAANPAILSELLKRAGGGGDQTDTMRNLAWRAEQAGLQPGTPEYANFMATGGKNDGVTVNNIMGGEKFGEEFAKGDAQALSSVSEAGMSAQRNIARIDRLDSLLAGVETGAQANFKQIAANYGIKLGDDVNNIQAATAIINSLIPEQRPPGSGPMSDMDLLMFKDSLPRIINQPGGNKMIIDTMRAIAKYDAEGAAIVQSLRSGKIERAEAFEMLQNRVNPLAMSGSGNRTSTGVQWSVEP